MLLKLDISRAFDSISWAFLFEVLRKMGFGASFLQWIAISLRTASTKILVNGIPGRKIMHVRGLCQGDPISPQLFVLGMEVFSLLVRRAVEEELLDPIGRCTPVQRVSIYADDVVMFLKPSVQDLVTVRGLLRLFGEASGLRVNCQKSSATLIRGNEQDEERVQRGLQCAITRFPVKYLGLQLALRPLTRAEWQPMLDKVVDFRSEERRVGKECLL